MCSVALLAASNLALHKHPAPCTSSNPSDESRMLCSRRQGTHHQGIDTQTNITAIPAIRATLPANFKTLNAMRMM